VGIFTSNRGTKGERRPWGVHYEREGPLILRKEGDPKLRVLGESRKPWEPCGEGGKGNIDSSWVGVTSKEKVGFTPKKKKTTHQTPKKKPTTKKKQKPKTTKTQLPLETLARSLSGRAG